MAEKRVIIRWTNQERAKVLAFGARILTSDPNVKNHELLVRAQRQAELPDGRLRPITDGNAYFFRQDVKKWMEKHPLIDEPPKVVQPAVPAPAQERATELPHPSSLFAEAQQQPAQQPPAAAPRINTPLEIPFEEAPPPPSLASVFVTAAVDLLVDVVTGVLRHEETMRAVRALTSDSPAFAPHSPFMFSWAKTNRLRVLIAGLEPRQVAEIRSRKELAEVLDLQFWRKDESKDSLRGRSRYADLVIACTGKISHQHDSIMYDAITNRRKVELDSPPRYVRTSGMTTTVLSILNYEARQLQHSAQAVAA